MKGAGPKHALLKWIHIEVAKQHRPSMPNVLLHLVDGGDEAYCREDLALLSLPGLAAQVYSSQNDLRQAG